MSRERPTVVVDLEDLTHPVESMPRELAPPQGMREGDWVAIRCTRGWQQIPVQGRVFVSWRPYWYGKALEYIRSTHDEIDWVFVIPEHPSEISTTLWAGLTADSHSSLPTSLESSLEVWVRNTWPDAARRAKFVSKHPEAHKDFGLCSLPDDCFLVISGIRKQARTANPAWGRFLERTCFGQVFDGKAGPLHLHPRLIHAQRNMREEMTCRGWLHAAFNAVSVTARAPAMFEQFWRDEWAPYAQELLEAKGRSVWDPELSHRIFGTYSGGILRESGGTRLCLQMLAIKALLRDRDSEPRGDLHGQWERLVREHEG